MRRTTSDWSGTSPTGGSGCWKRMRPIRRPSRSTGTRSRAGSRRDPRDPAVRRGHLQAANLKWVQRLRAVRQDSGFTDVTLWTEHRNERPLRFYRAAGWRLDGTDRWRIFRGTELLELRHRLTLSTRR